MLAARVLSVLLSLLVCVAQEPEKPQDAVPLFNGQDLTGWEPVGKNAAEAWKVDGGDLVCTGKGGGWLRSKEEYGDYEFQLEYLLKEGGNSGVYIRVPADGQHHLENAGKEGAGIEVQILDDHAPKYKDLKAYQYTGSLYAIVPAEPRVGKAPGEWNSLVIRCQGTRYAVHHNGQQVIKADETTAPDLAKRRRTGFIGLQDHSEEVRFRNIRIRKLTPADDKPSPDTPLEEKK